MELCVLTFDECAANGTHNCHLGRAMCTNAVGSFICSSKSGYARNRTLCTNTDECADGTHNCHPCRPMSASVVGTSGMLRHGSRT